MIPQRRETSHRKAKDKSNITLLLHHGITDMDDAEDFQEFVDSDSDPAWSPLKVKNFLSELILLTPLISNSGNVLLNSQRCAFACI